MFYYIKKLRFITPWLLICFVSIVFTFIYIFPSSLIEYKLNKITNGYINIINSSGSIWNGSGSLMFSTKFKEIISTVLQGKIKWRIEFFSLFRGILRIHVFHRNMIPNNIVIEMTMNSFFLSKGIISVPIYILNGLGSPFNTLNLHGNMQFIWTDCRIFNKNIFGNLSIILKNISSSISSVKPLGSYKVFLKNYNKNISSIIFFISTYKGPLIINGEGLISSGSILFNGIAKCSPKYINNLSSLLNLIGKQVDKGIVELKFIN